jgi:hypothetical protein
MEQVKTYKYMINGKEKVITYKPKDKNNRVSIKIIEAVPNMLLDYIIPKDFSMYRFYDDFKKRYPDLKCSRSYFLKIVKNNKLFSSSI